jgi:hypothetical protein
MQGLSEAYGAELATEARVLRRLELAVVFLLGCTVGALACLAGAL